MKRAHAIAVLLAHQDRLTAMGVVSVALFGSVARDEAEEGSDVDLLVEFNRPVSYFDVIEVEQYLTGALGCDVDISTPSALQGRFKVEVERDLFHVT